MSQGFVQVSCLSALFSLSASYCCSAEEKIPTAPNDPFTYCSAMRNLDAPAGGSSPIPAALMPYLGKTFGLRPDSPMAPQNYYWRCMDGAVYVCAVGANIPCGAKADRVRRNLGAENYCRENREATFVPAYATGHASIYRWSCSGGNALRGRRVSKIDHQGFRADIWYRVVH